MRIRRLVLERFRGIDELTFYPGPRTVILGPNNAGKSTVLEALDLLLHHGFGRPRPAPTEIDYYGRDPSAGFRIEAVLGDLPAPFLAEVRDCLEGWNPAERQVVPEPGGDGVEHVVRVQAHGTSDYEVLHEFSKPEVAGARFGPRLRMRVGWVFDGRARDPARQLAFYQGGLLDRLFSEVDLHAPIAALREALDGGASAINAYADVEAVLRSLATDLQRLGFLTAEERPHFELGAVSRRELLQALRLGLPGTGGVRIPLSSQGRGTQRLVLVAVLLRLAQAAGVPTIGAFEEPEEALEPLRQTQLARMLSEIVTGGGQIFVVTHSPEIVRAFALEDILLMPDRRLGIEPRALGTALSPGARHGYERSLDGPAVRGLFARIPILVEGPGDRAVFNAFWRALADAGRVAPADQLGLDTISCEGSARQPQMARLLAEAGKVVVAWVEQDRPDTIQRLTDDGFSAVLLLYDPGPEFQNLEQALSHGGSLPGLAIALTAVAADRRYPWEEQRYDLVSRAGPVGITAENRERMQAAASLPDLLGIVPEPTARALIASALAGKEDKAPFSIKGARHARILAESLAATEGVPALFALAFQDLAAWVANGCPRGHLITMREA